jgi:hypothetical protein
MTKLVFALLFTIAFVGSALAAKNGNSEQAKFNQGQCIKATNQGGTFTLVPSSPGDPTTSPPVLPTPAQTADTKDECKAFFQNNPS